MSREGERERKSGKLIRADGMQNKKKTEFGGKPVGLAREALIHSAQLPAHGNTSHRLRFVSARQARLATLSTHPWPVILVVGVADNLLVRIQLFGPTTAEISSVTKTQDFAQQPYYLVRVGPRLPNGFTQGMAISRLNGGARGWHVPRRLFDLLLGRWGCRWLSLASLLKVGSVIRRYKRAELRSRTTMMTKRGSCTTGPPPHMTITLRYEGLFSVYHTQFVAYTPNVGEGRPPTLQATIYP